MGAHNVFRWITDAGKRKLRGATPTTADFGTATVKVDTLAESTSSNKTTLSSGATIPTGKVLAVADADGITSGGVILPKTLVITRELWPHASLKTRNIVYVNAAYTVTSITYEPDIAEGTGSVVCTVCKVTGNSVAVAATTPMCTAFAVTGTAGTPVTATLTSTAADLVLAATNKIGCIFSGGDEFLDTGRGILTITMTRS